jgi:hypothetical protein
MEDRVFICSACESKIYIDPYLMYTYDDIKNKKLSDVHHYWQSKYSYAKEVESNVWLYFCKRVCEIKYERQYETDWEFSTNKKKLLTHNP